MNEEKIKFEITPTLGFIYQVTNKKNVNSLPKWFTEPSFIFSYEDAIECSNDLESPKWEIVKKYIDHFDKNWNNYPDSKYLEKIDKEFLLELFKKEALELQKGNLTFLHSKDIRFLVLDIISQLISGSYEGFKPKCLKKDDEINKSALEIIKDIYELPDIKATKNKDHYPSVRKRIISSNISIFNNAFIGGESTLKFFLSKDSVLDPYTLLRNLNLNNKIKNYMIDLMFNIKDIGKNLITMYSIPIEHLSKYVFPSKSFGLIDENQEDIYLNVKAYLDKKSWNSDFEYQYSKQFRILDLCYTKYSYKQGVRIYQLTDISQDNLKIFVRNISRILKKEKDLTDWVNTYIDISEKKVSKPVKFIRTIKSGNIFQRSNSISPSKSTSPSPKSSNSKPDCKSYYHKVLNSTNLLDSEKLFKKIENINSKEGDNVCIWIIDEIKNGYIKEEDLEDVEKILQLYFHNSKFPLPVFNIAFEKKYSNYLLLQDILNKKVDLLYTGEYGLLLMPNNKDALCFYGESKWCEDFSSKDGYIWFDYKNNDKFYFNFEEMDFYNKNKPISKILFEEFRKDHPILENLFEEMLNKIIDKIKNGFIKDENLINFISYYFIEGRWPEAEPYIMKNPIYSYFYARDILEERWRAAEQYITKDTKYLKRYLNFFNLNPSDLNS
jgi:hypothetical protein